MDFNSNYGMIFVFLQFKNQTELVPKSWLQYRDKEYIGGKVGIISAIT